MKTKIWIALLIISNLITFLVTWMIYIDPVCQIDGNPFDCDEYNQVTITKRT